MSKRHFDILILNGRPAAGKSEIIDYLKKVPVEERIERFHIGNFVEIDDFPFIWSCFEDDDIMTKYGRERIWTDEKYYFKDPFLWKFFIEKINYAYRKLLAERPNLHDDTTVLIEFARGGKNGLREAYETLDDEILKKAGILYIYVTYEESVRKNRRRFKPHLAHTSLFHGLPDDKMEYYYKETDWDELAAKDPNYIHIKGFKIPYAVFNNMPEKTLDPKLLAPELEKACNKLWSLMHPEG